MHLEPPPTTPVLGPAAGRDEAAATTGVPAAPDHFFRHLVTIALLAGLAVAMCTSLRPGGAEVYEWVSNLTQIVAPVLVVVAAVAAGRRSPDRHRHLGWWLIASSAVAWGLGSVAWAWLELTTEEIPFPSIADLGYLASVPLAVAGLLAFPAAPQKAGRTRAVLDAVIVAGSVLFVSWVVVLGPTADDASTSGFARALSLGYPVGDAVLLTIVIIVSVRATSHARATMAFVGIGYAALAVADSSFVASTLEGVEITPLSDTMWFLGWVLIALGATYAVRHPEPSHPDDGPPGRFALLLPYLPLGAVLAVIAASNLMGRELSIAGAEFWIGLALVAALLARQAVVLLDNDRLTRSLAGSNARLAQQALHDQLTGLPNRTLFSDRLAVAVAHTTRRPALLAVMFVDLDAFKPVNDRFGHKVGDAVLRAVADRITQVTRGADTVARFGGDEFLVLCERLPSAESALAVAERIHDAVTAPVPLHEVGATPSDPAGRRSASTGPSVTVGASIGMVLADSPRDHPDELLRLADASMYERKQGRVEGIAVVDRTLGVAPAALDAV